MPALDNPKWEKFCQSYVREPNGAKAYREAGYRVTNERSACAAASRLLADVNIKARIRELNDAIYSETIMSAAEMQATLSAIARGETTEEVVTTVGTGEGCSAVEIAEKKPSNADRVRAMNLLAKMRGELDHKVSITGAVPVVISGGEQLED